MKEGLFDVIVFSILIISIIFMLFIILDHNNYCKNEANYNINDCYEIDYTENTSFCIKKTSLIDYHYCITDTLTP